MVPRPIWSAALADEAHLRFEGDFWGDRELWLTADGRTILVPFTGSGDHRLLSRERLETIIALVTPTSSKAHFRPT